MKWWTLTIVAILALLASFGFGFLGDPWLMGIGVFGAIAVLVVANLDRISEFKASATGFEGKTREVNAALTELRLLAVQVGELTLSLLKRSGRMGGYTDEEEHAFKESVLDVLRKVGATESQIDRALWDWHRLTEFDYAYFIINANFLPDVASQEMGNEWRNLVRDGLRRVPRPDEIRAVAKKHQFLTSRLDEHIKDYEFYIAHKTHRRPELWKDRQNWRRRSD